MHLTLGCGQFCLRESFQTGTSILAPSSLTGSTALNSCSCCGLTTKTRPGGRYFSLDSTFLSLIAPVLETSSLTLFLGSSQWTRTRQRTLRLSFLHPAWLPPSIRWGRQPCRWWWRRRFGPPQHPSQGCLHPVHACTIGYTFQKICVEWGLASCVPF